MENKEALLIRGVLRVMQEMIEFPYAEICRHNVACSLYGMLEKHGVELPVELAKTLVDCSEGDERSLEIIENLLESSVCN